MGGMLMPEDSPVIGEAAGDDAVFATGQKLFLSPIFRGKFRRKFSADILQGLKTLRHSA